LTFILTFLERKKLTDCAKATKDVWSFKEEFFL
jgi:hypothetical protein